MYECRIKTFGTIKVGVFISSREKISMYIVVILFVFNLARATHIDGTVNLECNTPDSEAVIKYVGDPYGVLAVTKNGSVFWFNEDIASATYTMSVSYQNTTDSQDIPVFDKHPEMNLYTITVQARMMFRDFEDSSDENFLVECNFEAYVDDVAGKSDIEDAPTVPKIVRMENGIRSESNFSVEMVKIDGSAFVSEDKKYIGRWVKLKATMSPAGGDVDFTVNTCFAYAGDNSSTSEKVAIIVEGCGTSLPFGKEQGFLKEEDNPLVAFSPVFRTFIVKRGEGKVSFMCDFIICENNTCGMSTCAAENEAMSNEGTRRRRSVVPDAHTREVTTERGGRKFHFHEVMAGRKVEGRKIVKARTRPTFIDMRPSTGEISNASSNANTAKVVGNVKFMKSRRISQMEFQRARQRVKFRAYSKEIEVIEDDSFENITESPERLDVTAEDYVSAQKVNKTGVDSTQTIEGHEPPELLKSDMNTAKYDKKLLLRDLKDDKRSSHDIMVVVIVTICVVVVTSLTLSVFAAYVVTKRTMVRMYAPPHREPVSLVSYCHNTS